MEKLKLYVDTSVFSHLFAEDAPDMMADTHLFWADLVAERYEVFISGLVIEELSDCPEPKRGKIFGKMNEIAYQELSETSEVGNLAEQYVHSGVLGKKHFEDCTHIAHAVVYGCDMIVSWNFKHLVNYRTISGVKTINAINQYNEIHICSPTMLLQEGKL